MNEEKYPIGTEVYYQLEDYDTGEDLIYKGKITDIYNHEVNLLNKKHKMKIYKINDQIGMQRNAFYTLEELMAMANRLQYLTKEIDKTKAIEKEV